jgi:hypothetical protein
MRLANNFADAVGRSGARTWRRDIEEFLFAGQSLTLRGRPHRSSLTFAMPQAHGRVPTMALDDDLQHSWFATLTGPLVRRLPSIMSPQHLFGTDRSPFLPPSLLTQTPRSQPQLVNPFSFYPASITKLPSISARRTILDDSATII